MTKMIKPGLIVPDKIKPRFVEWLVAPYNAKVLAFPQELANNRSVEGQHRFRLPVSLSPRDWRAKRESQREVRTSGLHSTISICSKTAGTEMEKGETSPPLMSVCYTICCLSFSYSLVFYWLNTQIQKNHINVHKKHLKKLEVQVNIVLFLFILLLFGQIFALWF